MFRSFFRAKPKTKPVVNYTRLQVEQLEDRLAPATINYLGVNSNWNDSANWSGGVVPTYQDEAVFNNASGAVNVNVANVGTQVKILTFTPGFTLTITGELTVDQLQLGGGTITGPGTLSVVNSLDWTAGTMSGTGTTRILSGASANIAQTATGGTGGPLADSRTFLNLGDTTWNGPFTIPSTALVTNQGTLTFANTDFTYDTFARVTNTGTLVFSDGNVTFSGPLTVEGHVKALRTPGAELKNVSIFGDVTLRNFTLQQDLAGAGTLTVTGTFAWDCGKLSGVGSTIVPAGGTLDLPSIEGFRKLAGRTLTVLGQRTWVAKNVSGTLAPGGRLLDPDVGPMLPTYSSILAWSDAQFSSPDLPFDNKSAFGPAATPSSQPSPFNAIAVAGAATRATIGGAFGIGTEEDPLFAALETIRSQADASAVANEYVVQNPGRSFYQDLLAELSGDDWKRAESLYTYDWNRYVAVTIHQKLFEWSWSTNVDLMVRLIRDARTNVAQIPVKYAAEYNQAELSTDLTAKLNVAQCARVNAALTGNTAREDAAFLWQLFRHSANLFEEEAVFSLLKSRTPAQIQAIRLEYNSLQGSYAFDSDMQSYFMFNENYWPYAQALMNGDKVLATVRRLHLAVGGVGTDEEMFWNALNGLYADERAMVAQVYRDTYFTTVLEEINDEFSDNMFDGPEHQRSFKLYSHGGLSLAERVYYAVAGWGTDEVMLQAALGEIRNMNPADLGALRLTYLEVGGGESLNEAILGDLGGRENFEATQDLLGRPQTSAEWVARLNARRDYERSGFLNLGTTFVADGLTLGFYSSTLNPLQQHASNYEASVQAAINYYDQNKDANGNLTPAQEAEFQRLMQVADQHLQTYRDARSAMADLAANTLATAAGIAVVIASGGTATPLVVALAAGAGGATQALTRMGLNGEFNWEQLPADLLTGAVNAGTAALSMPANATGASVGILRRVGGSAFGGGALGGGLSTAMNENTWQDGFAVGTLRVTGSALTTGTLSAAFPAMVGAGVIAARRAMPFVSRVMTSAGTTVTANIFDPTWVRNGVAAIRSGGQTVRQYLETTLVGWANKGDEIANAIRAWGAAEPESTLRQNIVTILELTGWGQRRNDLIIERALAFANANRAALPGMTQSAIKEGVEQQTGMHFMSMTDSVDSLRTRIGTLGANLSDDAADSLAQRLATIPDGDNAALRAALSDTLPSGTTITDDIMRTTRDWMHSPSGLDSRLPGRGVWDIASDYDRGFRVEQVLGGRTGLADNFPVIDQWQNGVATNIKSLDLTRNYYIANPRSFRSVFENYIDETFEFARNAPVERDGITISPFEVVRRELVIAIPPLSATNAQAATLVSLVEYGQSKGVIVRIVELR